MPPEARTVQRTYLLLTLLTVLAASMIWGINTLFLLDAGLSNTQAFTANAFFTAGDGAFRGAHRHRRRHPGAPDVLRPRRNHTAGVHVAVPADVADRGAALGMGHRLGGHRAGFHVLLGGDRGMVGRCTGRNRLHRSPGVCVRPRPGVRRIRRADRSISGGFIAQATNLGVPYLVVPPCSGSRWWWPCGGCTISGSPPSAAAVRSRRCGVWSEPASTSGGSNGRSGC